MANETSINRSSPSDANFPATRKKQFAHGVDFGQQSLFEELLTIGQLESTIPEAALLPAAKSPDSSGQFKSDYDKEVVSESEDESAPSEEGSSTPQVQANFPAQAITPQLQQPTAQHNKEGLIEDKGNVSRVKANSERGRNGDELADTNSLKPAPTTVEADSNKADALIENSITPVIVDNSAIIATEGAPAETAPLLTANDNNVVANKNEPDQTVQKGRASANASDSQDRRAKSENETPELASTQPEAKPSPSIALSEFNSNKESAEEQINSALRRAYESTSQQTIRTIGTARIRQ